MANPEKPYYGYRVNAYITVALIGAGIVNIALALTFTISMYTPWAFILCWALGAILLIGGVFWHLCMSWPSSSEKVAPLQDNFLDLLGNVWNNKGKVLDIGTGRGRVAVETAKRFPQAQVIGVDTWTKLWAVWGQTRAGAEKNARIEKVSDRCTFQYGSALDLPFEDGEFQLVVSTFVFHEIHVLDRTVLLKEVIRVLAPGGHFLICDLFGGPFLRAYTVRNIRELLDKVKQLGAEEVEYKPLNEAGVNLGRLSHIWGIAYLSGRKKELGGSKMLKVKKLSYEGNDARSRKRQNAPKNGL